MGIICKINKNKIEMAEVFLKNAIDFLIDERLIVFPMESIYAFGASAFGTEGLLLFQEIFQNQHSFIPIVLVDSIAIAKKIVEFNPIAEKIAKSVWPGNLAMTLPKNKTAVNILLESNPDFVFKDSDQISVQISNDPIVKRLLDILKQQNLPPMILGTPVFIPSQIIGNNISEIVDYFGHDKFSILLDIGKLSKGKTPLPNTILDLTDKSLKIVQNGSIDVNE